MQSRFSHFVAYYRVSTARQGKSGLGLEAQRKVVLDHLSRPDSRLIAEFTEVESGRRSDRPELHKALALCRAHRAVLIIAKLDRLARNVAFVSNLMESGVDFEAVDFPQANRFTLHVMAAVAEHETKLISERTRSALAAAKVRGVKLGGYRGRIATADDRAKGRARRTEIANQRARDLKGIVMELREQGLKTLSEIAGALTEKMVPTPGSSRLETNHAKASVWTPVQVKRLLSRLEPGVGTI